MNERKGVPMANKIAMSKALGAAFLNHQVEQLEKTVSNGPGSGNWRDRRLAPTSINTNVSPAKRNPNTPAGKGPRKRGGDMQPTNRDSTRSREKPDAPHRRSPDVERFEKDADVIVVDASVLIHGLEQLKRWSRPGRTEKIIIPLEALNTLDLLKKGSSTLAQRARAASRILEAQVGSDTRIMVQQDDAYTPWDKIAFQPSDSDGDKSPEWIRRTICCARWEADTAAAKETSPKLKVVLAVCSSNTSLSPQATTLKLTDDAATPLTPVPLPAPNPPQPNRYEPRCNGALVSHWGAKAGIELFEVKPIMTTQPGNPRSSSEEDRPGPKRINRPRRPTQSNGSADAGRGVSGSLVERSPAVMAMMEMVSQPTKVVRVLARGEKLDPDP